MTTLTPALLALEAIVVALGVPVAAAAGNGRAAWLLGLLAVLLIVAGGVARRRRPLAVGWAMQALVLLVGLVTLPAVVAIGLVFLVVWVVAVIYGGKADAIAAARASASPEDAPRPDGVAGEEEPLGGSGGG